MLTLYEYPIHPNLHKFFLADGTIKVIEGEHEIYCILWNSVSYNRYCNGTKQISMKSFMMNANSYWS